MTDNYTVSIYADDNIIYNFTKWVKRVENHNCRSKQWNWKSWKKINKSNPAGYLNDKAAEAKCIVEY